MKKDTEVKLFMQARHTGATQHVAAARAGMSERTARRYERAGKLPSELKRPHTWRTRPNPFEEDWPWVVQELQRDPALQGTTLFALLCERHPQRYQPIQVRTLQRHIAQWKALHGPEQDVIFEQRHQPGERGQSDFTHMNDLGVTISGVAGFNWQKDLQDQVMRAPINKAQLEVLLSRAGVSNDATIVLYGDHHNWFAAWTFWLLKYYGHRDVRLLDGGRVKWLAQRHGITTQVPSYPPASYTAQAPRNTMRAFRDQVLLSLGCKGAVLLDVRSPGEYSGELPAPGTALQEGVQRGGHIPGAVNIPWAMAVREDGTFRSAEELRTLYAGKGVTSGKEVIVYCHIGERSSHTWFVLHSLLGYARVLHYDGSWTEWGSLIGAPIEK